MSAAVERRSRYPDVRVGLVASAVALALTAALSAYAWHLAPATIPTHWGIDGQPNGYSGKASGLLFGPGLVLGCALLFLLLPLIDPRRRNLVRSARAYNGIWVGVMVVATAGHVVVVLYAIGRPIPVDRVIGTAIGVLFVVLGNYLPKLRSSWFVGIRTPWTLSSEHSWSRTHRIGGFLFMATGLAVVVGSLAFDAMVPPLFGGLIVILAVTIPYSWWAWRHDPHRTSEPREPAQ